MKNLIIVNYGESEYSLSSSGAAAPGGRFFSETQFSKFSGYYIMCGLSTFKVESRRVSFVYHIYVCDKTNKIRFFFSNIRRAGSKTGTCPYKE